ncbi:UDP-N-acetylglucosamine 2-epimerase [Legionella wadsworthii]|uniref:UDP-N-acetylglucosamine 2-epimerase (non-hydrolyzing) n=2 Tax=Legionella wadsworthii TaxID=28088 RepID=A0A378LR53_9GAMM|nr:UDP-N-acetylglucosamine 2-epimerase [Legionella wadsworthii]
MENLQNGFLMLKKILCIIGTRPEAIKMAPIIKCLKSESWCELRVAVTAQHREMLDQMLATFQIKQDIDLDIMQPNQELSLLTSKMLVLLDEVFKAENPDAIIAQGDTTTTLVASLAAFYRHIPFYHVEAGLRTKDMRNPFPEELNRVLISKISSLHFAPTLSNERNLLQEGIDSDTIFVTGNTVIDALKYIVQLNITPNLDLDPSKRLLLVTAHRRENIGKPFKEICKALRQLVEAFDDIQIVFPVHPNPNVKQVAYEELSNYRQILLIPPLEYNQFVCLLNKAYFVLTDSGGVQEEAPALGKPVLVLRSTTERPEGIEEGVAKLVMLNAKSIFEEAAKLLNSKDLYQGMVKEVLPYGDGTASIQIVNIIKKKLLNSDKQ